MNKLIHVGLWLILCIQVHAQSVVKVASLAPLPENSGLEWVDGKLWTFEDSGNPAKLYSIDTSTGSILQTVSVSNFSNVDWEDITSDKDFIYIGDFGNNNGNRTDLRILQIKKSDIGNAKDVMVNAKAIQFTYADQTDYSPNKQTNFDCESVISIHDSLFLFTKNRGDLKTRVYALPKTTDTKHVISPLATFNVGGKITAATYDSSSNRVLLLGYGGGSLNTFLYELSGLQTNPFTVATEKHTVIGNNFLEWQTESLAFIDSIHLFLSNEYTSNVSAGLYRIDLNGKNTLSVEKKSEVSKRIQCYPNPTTHGFHVVSDGTINELAVLNTNGQIVFIKHIEANEAHISLNEISYVPGIYFVKLLLNDQVIIQRLVVN